MDLNNKVCVITGAAKGIGLSIVKELLAAGASVVLADIDERGLKQAVKELSSDHVLTCKTDIAKEQDVKALVETVKKKWERIDVWVNNAGLARHKAVTDIEEQDIDLMMDVNVKGTILGSKHALLEMEKSRSGHIVNIISTAGLRGIPGQSVYCSSKWAIRGFSEALHEEAAVKGIRVTSILPGGVDTEFWDGAQENKPPTQLFLSPIHIAKGVMAALMMDDICVTKEMVLRSIRDVDTLQPEAP